MGETYVFETYVFFSASYVSSQQVSGADPVLYKEPEKHLVLWPARRSPNPVEDWDCRNGSP
jgi:hypothetical protein